MHRVIQMAVSLVVEDGLPYRPASWHLWRDHRVFVGLCPAMTLQRRLKDALVLQGDASPKEVSLHRGNNRGWNNIMLLVQPLQGRRG